MNGSIYAITEILAFLVATTAIGFMLGRVTAPRRAESGRLSKLVMDTELAESRELIASLEHKLEVAMAAAARVEPAPGDESLAERLAEAEATITELHAANEELQAVSEQATGPAPDDPAEIARLQAALEEQQREIERLEAIAREAAEPMDVPAKQAAAAPSSAGGDDAEDGSEASGAEVGAGARGPAVGWSTGSGGFADTLVEFD